MYAQEEHSERRKLEQSLFEQIALFCSKLSGAWRQFICRIFASQDPGTLLPWVFSRFLAHGARPLEIAHLLLQFPGPGTVVLFLSERVTLLVILKGTLKRQTGMQHVAFVWPPRSTIFDSVQQCCILLPGLRYGLMKRYWKYSNRETPV